MKTDGLSEKEMYVCLVSGKDLCCFGFGEGEGNTLEPWLKKNASYVVF